MKEYITYLKLEFKRSITILPTIIGSMVFMLLFIVGISVLISNYIYKSNLFEPITVGIVIPEDEIQAKSIARLISTIDSVNKTSEFEYMSELEARYKIERGELEVAILLDHEFFETVYAGYNAPAKILFSEESSLNSEVFLDLLNAAESIIRTTEAGAYSIADLRTYYEAETSWSDVASTSFIQYLETALMRGGLFSENILSSIGNLSFFQYYATLSLLCFLLMNGLNYGYLYAPNDKSVEQRLRFIGISNFKITLTKVIILSSSLWIFSIIIYLLGLLLSKHMEISLLTFDLGIFIKLIPVLFSIATYIHWTYILSGKRNQGGILLFFTNLFMIICSGGIIPLAYMPKAIESIARYLPFSYWNQYIAKAVFDRLSAKDVLLAICIGLVFILLGEVKSWKDI